MAAGSKRGIHLADVAEAPVEVVSAPAGISA